MPTHVHPAPQPRRRPAAGPGLGFLLAGSLLIALPGCNLFTRLSEVGTGPGLSEIRDPQAQAGYMPVSLPMPAPLPAERNPNSLWRHGARAFFKDQRAAKVGDILTVVIVIDDSASIANSTSRTRTASEAAGIPNFLGLEGGSIQRILDTADLGELINADSAANNDGQGNITRAEQIELRVAALVTQVLPNGNLVLQGKQEVRVNFELRDLTIQGVIRPEDITARNEITYDKIAEARISYGGRGQIMDAQQPRWGQQIYDVVWPW